MVERADPLAVFLRLGLGLSGALLGGAGPRVWRRRLALRPLQAGDVDRVVHDRCLPGDFVVEFSDAVVADKGYNIAMWSSSAKTITYYKLVDGAYQKVVG